MTLGKWRVFRTLAPYDHLRWAAWIPWDVETIRAFPTHAEALAYALAQAEAGR